jgi:hypothetical protein
MELITPESYIENLSEDRREAMGKLHHIFVNHLPDGFAVGMTYKMIGYFVPHSIYPNGYHCDPKMPLPFINLGAQKSHIAVYHMGLYMSSELSEWFLKVYTDWNATLPKPKKIDMGKSCIRFKKTEDIPFHLFEELAKKMTVQEWIEGYEKVLKK